MYAASGAQNKDAVVPPADVYISLVASLFGEARSLFIGAGAASIGTLIAAWMERDPTFAFCAVGIWVVTILRAYHTRAFYRALPQLKTAEQTRKWEIGYGVGASAKLGLLGIFCLLAFTRTDDAFTQLFAFTTTIAYMVGVSGRNFASSRIVLVQTIAAGLPMTAALMVGGGNYYFIIVFVLVPFFIAMPMISKGLRATLLQAVISAHNISLLAKRFDTALNNMPHGLAMFDADRRLVVANQRLAALFRVPAETLSHGASVRDIIGEASLSGVVTEPERLSNEFEARLAGGQTAELVVESGAGTVLSLTFQPMENGSSVVLIEDITERRNAEARIDQLARYDPLTGLPNRNFLRDQMELALAATRRQSRSCAVFFVDLDHFKQVNDTLGHRYGDRILCAVADRLRKIMGPEDFVARFGGDEFIAVMPLLSGRASAEASAERIVIDLSEPYEIEGHQIVLGASVGIAVAPDHSSDPDRLLKQSDTALYHAKSSGRGAWCFFEHEMAVKAQARRSLELDLRSALHDGSFEVYYQPLYNLKQKRFGTCEALVRWRHPERGMISPAEFIPVAEEMGLIVEIGEWVLKRACSECLAWPEGTRVAVNLSPIQFRRASVVGSVTEALLRAGLPPARLEVEITESVLLQDVQQTRGQLAQLRALGVNISLDDFGTGYSSLSYLQNFRLSKVKIDRSFLTGLGSSDRSMILLRGVARLSAELGMVVAVEGVETQEQLDLVDCRGDVDEVQGYLFGRPMPAREIREFLRNAEKKAEKVA